MFVEQKWPVFASADREAIEPATVIGPPQNVTESIAFYIPAQGKNSGVAFLLQLQHLFRWRFQTRTLILVPVHGQIQLVNVNLNAKNALQDSHRLAYLENCLCGTTETLRNRIGLVTIHQPYSGRIQINRRTGHLAVHY